MVTIVSEAIYFNTRFCAATIRERQLFLLSLLDTVEVGESDPFADVEEDENELEENKVVLEDCYIVAVTRVTSNCMVLPSSYARTRFVHVLYSNICHGYHSRAATISFSSAGSAATIQERRLIESGV